MKKNLISILILALLIVNIVLTAIMMFSVTSTNSKTAALVTDIASAVSLDIEGMRSGASAVPLENTATYTIADMTILLKDDANQAEGTEKKDHYAQLTVVLSMDNRHEDFAANGNGDLSSRQDLIKGRISDVVGKYTLDEAKQNTQAITTDILNSIQGLFDSDFIFEVTLVSPLYM
ncbi:MAG: hypothetical protein K2P30_13945 [Lachnospiraceae bacterium]|nr:hypothetical protein [Lachnospiraceae bacterium]